MKKAYIIALAMAVLLCVLPVSAAETAVDASVMTGCNTLDGQIPFLGSNQLVSNTGAAVLYETNTDTLMYAHNADVQVPPASLVKILTALVAIEKGSLEDAVTVRADVLATLAPDAAVVELEADEVLTVNDLLYCMMVGSGNDAAVVLADHVMGSQEAFVAEMNRYAAELGCTGTNFTNVHGLHDENQYTTARDTARILSKAIQNPQFCEVFGAIYYSVPKTNKADERHLSSKNYLVNNDTDINYFDERVTGSRTGVATDRSRCIASVAQVEDMNLVCVVMGAKSQYEKDGYTEKVYGGYQETKQLFDLGFQGYKTAQILYSGQVLQQSSVLNGNCDVSMGAMNGASAVIPANVSADALSYRYVDEIGLTAPIEAGQKVSALQIWYGSVCLAQSDVYAMNSVATAGSVLTEDAGVKGAGSFGRVVLYLLAAAGVIALVGFAVLYALRAVRIAKARKAARRRNRSRRRSR